MGRPKKRQRDKLCAPVAAYLTENEKKSFVALLKNRGLKRSEFLRNIVMNWMDMDVKS